jgi:apolipoprotein N-acyltransferase
MLTDLSTAGTQRARPSTVPLLPSLLNPMLALLGGVLGRYSFGLDPVWWLAWLAPLPLLVAVLRSSQRQAWLLATLAGVIIASANASYYRVLMGMPGAIIVTLLQALTWTLVVCLSRRVMLGSATAFAALAYPLLWAAFDTLSAALLPDGNWGSIAHSQAGYLPAAQIVALAGVPALVFVLSSPASALALLVMRGPRDRAALLATASALLLALAGWTYGVARLAAPSAPGVPVGLAVIDAWIGPETPAARSNAIWTAYELRIAQLAKQGARIVVLPEKIAVLDTGAAKAVERRLAAAASSAHVWLVVGVGLEDAKGRRNLAWLFGPDGTVSGRYQKQHMAPPERSFLAGHAAVVSSVDDQRLGLAICKDMHFASVGRQYAGLGVNAMLVPAWDFVTDAGYAARLSALRSIEGGFAMARASREGYLTVNDAYGRVIAQTHSAPLPGATLLARLPASAPPPTLYAKTGDAFGWLCMVATGLFGLWSMLARRRIVSKAQRTSRV